MSPLTKILEERGRQYGPFARQAEIVQGLKFWIPKTGLQPDQREALEMIMNKIGRICNGNADKIDSWMDIAGYATLVAERLTNEKELSELPSVVDAGERLQAWNLHALGDAKKVE